MPYMPNWPATVDGVAVGVAVDMVVCGPQTGADIRKGVSVILEPYTPSPDPPPTPDGPFAAFHQLLGALTVKLLLPVSASDLTGVPDVFPLRNELEINSALRNINELVF